MKLTNAELTQLLTAIGLQDVQVVEEGSEYNQDVALQAIDTARSTILKPRFRTELLEEVKGQSMRMTDTAIEKRLIALTGIDKGDLKDLTYEEKIEKAFEHAKGTLGKDTEGLREELKSMLSKHNEALESEKKQRQELDNSWKGKWNSREIKAFLRDQLKEAPINDKADKDILAEDFQNYLANKFHLSYDEAGKALNLFTKENPEIPALNETKTAAISLLDEAKTFFTPRGQWETDMRNKRPEDKGEPYKQNNNGSNPLESAKDDPFKAQEAALAAYMARP